MRYEHSAEELTRKNIETISRMQQAFNERRRFGEKVADLLARVFGSWPFLLIQTAILVVWMILNVVAWVGHWDPYPFILLNLALSFQAAYATPIIIMSQNRQAALDQRRNHLDLQINLLAEQENTEMLRLLRKLCERLRIPVEHGSLEALEQPTEPLEVIRQIDEMVQKQEGSEAPTNGQ